MFCLFRTETWPEVDGVGDARLPQDVAEDGDGLDVLVRLGRVFANLIGLELLVAELQLGDEANGGLLILLEVVALVDVKQLAKLRHDRAPVVGVSASGPAHGHLERG